MFFLLPFRKFRGFTLVDVMMAVTLSSLLVIILGLFAHQVFVYRTFVSQHQELRSELFPIVTSTLPGIIREATAIDYSESGEHFLKLFVDPYEKKAIRLSLHEEGDLKQLVLERGDEKLELHSQIVSIEELSFEIPPNPIESRFSRMQDLRSFQPLVKYYIKARYFDPEKSSLDLGSGFQAVPRLSYQGAATLRNYSFSHLRHL